MTLRKTKPKPPLGKKEDEQPQQKGKKRVRGMPDAKEKCLRPKKYVVGAFPENKRERRTIWGAEEVLLVKGSTEVKTGESKIIVEEVKMDWWEGKKKKLGQGGKKMDAHIHWGAEWGAILMKN